METKYTLFNSLITDIQLLTKLPAITTSFVNWLSCELPAKEDCVQKDLCFLMPLLFHHFNEQTTSFK